jgi:hypothetical protein
MTQPGRILLSDPGRLADPEQRGRGGSKRNADLTKRRPALRVFRGTRVPFQNLRDYLEAGDTLD